MPINIKQTLIGLAAAALSALFLAGCGGGDSASSADQGILRVAGDSIVDVTGRPVFLRGFQGLGAYPIPEEKYLEAVFDQDIEASLFDPIAEDILRYSLSDFDIHEIKATGANVIRLWTRLYEIKRGPGVFSQTALALLENTVDRFGAQGIRTVLVMAGAGENTYAPQQKYLDRGINLWDPASSARADSIEVWGVLAQRFAGNPNVAGYDVMNEPMPLTAESLHDYYTEVIATIRTNDPDHIIILAVAQGNRDTFQIGGSYQDGNIAVTFHFYEPHDFTLEPGIPGLTYPGVYDSKLWDEAAIAEAFDYAINLDQLAGKPIFVGEFGAVGERDGNGGLEWIGDVMAAMNDRGLHYTFHNYRENYWVRSAQAEAAVNQLVEGIVDGSVNYDALDESEKRSLFATELTCEKRAGIGAVVAAGFAGGTP